MGPHIIITPSHICDASIAIAGIRCGETGILDLGYNKNYKNMLRALDLLHHAAGDSIHWGVRWDTLFSPSRSPETLVKLIKSSIPIIVLAGILPSDMEAACQVAHQYASKVYLEVTTLKMAQIAQKSGCEGIIIKGNEASGFTGNESSFILAQQLKGQIDLPYWIWGGMGQHTISAVRVAGAQGGVFCEQLWLAEESPFSVEQKNLWKSMDGSETICLGHRDSFFRLYTRTGRHLIPEYEKQLAQSDNWRSTMAQLLLDASDDMGFIPCGQDIGMASHLAQTSGTISTIFANIKKNYVDHIEQAIKFRSLSMGAPLAIMHGTTYPIIQGPMANVSDVAPFSVEIADQGGLPFVAMSALPGPKIRELLKRIHDEIKPRPWGVGTLGFLPEALRNEQFQAIKEFNPPFAIIAGGRPSLAMQYEAEGISTYLHVPTPGLLKQFIKKGATKFIFEGRECGGHVGPLSSFTLWESAINILLTNNIDEPKQLQVLFAGGIHDALSSAMVQALAAPLSAVGIKLGVVMGSAYLFSKEAVTHGAITPEYQKQVLACETTHLLQSGIGHASCCVETPFIEKFYTAKQTLILSGKTDAEIFKELELMNLGRLKLASKGVSTTYKESPDKDHVKHIQIEETKENDDTQRNEGLFMIGQIALLKNKTFSIKQLHKEISHKSFTILEAFGPVTKTTNIETTKKQPLSPTRNQDIAIIGMACFLPEANNTKEYWQNILNQVCAIKEIPENRWIIDNFFDPDRKSSERTYSKWGGFLKDILFDPIKYSMAPKSLESIDSTQLLALEVATQALEQAGIQNPEFPRKRTAVFFGSGGINSLGMDFGSRVMAEYYSGKLKDIPVQIKEDILKTIKGNLPKWTTDSFPGVIGNVIAGRITNRLNLGGMNFTCDAACASSFAAMDIAIRQLRTNACDAAVVGGVDAGNHPLEYVMFSRAQVLSPTGKSLPLDDSADGIVLSEGAAAVVLKRLTDAERDKDHIFAVIKGMGGSSDGRNKSLVAPNSEGQVRAMKIAYEDAGISPETVTMMELHGTGTVIGDRVEMQACKELFDGYSIKSHNSCAVGSVKSMIGHTKITAGLAAVIKTALAIEHKILPPTMGVEIPNTKVNFTDSPFYINSDTRPWLQNSLADRRRAGLSCFGFGGSNFHMVMEEYSRNSSDKSVKNLIPRDVELFTFCAPTRDQLQKQIDHLITLLQGVNVLDFSQLAYSIFIDSYKYQPEKPDYRLNIVATSPRDLENKLKIILSDLNENNIMKREPQGIYYSEAYSSDTSNGSIGPICFLFPGQGSQRINMLKDLVVSIPETYHLIELADKLTHSTDDRSLSNYIFPIPVFSDEEKRLQQKKLNQTSLAQPAMGLMNLIAYDILQLFGIKPDMVAGHSYGEYVALCTAGVFSRKDLIEISESRGLMIEAFSKKKTGTMAAVQADSETTSRLIDTLGLNVSIANYNSPLQNVLSGPVEAIDKAVTAIEAQGIRIKKIPVTAAFHTRAMDSISDSLEKALKEITMNKPDITVFSNATALHYPEDFDEIRRYIKQHSSEAVNFEKMIWNMYGEGARLFIEVGPGRVLTGLVKSILGDAPYTAISLEAPGRSGWDQLSHLLAQVKSLGVPVDLLPCFEGRGLHHINTEKFITETKNNATPGPMAWRIFGGRGEAFYPISKGKKPLQKSQIETSPILKNDVTHKKMSKISSSNLAPFSSSIANQEKENTMPTQREKISSPPTAPNITDNSILSVLGQCNRTMAHLFEMQTEQHRTTQQFLKMQETMIHAALNGSVVANKSEGHSFPQPVVPSQIHKENLNFVTQPVPPAPTLPSLEKIWANPSPVVKPESPPQQSPERFNPEISPDVAVDHPTPPIEIKAISQLPDLNEFKQALIKATCGHTGFPEDMLDLNMNMEVDLGIDSIKKLEIFSTLDEKYQLMKNGNEELIIEELSEITSLGGIVEWYGKKREDFLNSDSVMNKGTSSANR
ncbi:beta-ketoacyl synthase N-terminal-like domain-containing protein [Desulfocicer niacini]